jgi:hypothetical protein
LWEDIEGNGLSALLEYFDDEAVEIMKARWEVRRRSTLDYK